MCEHKFTGHVLCVRCVCVWAFIYIRVCLDNTIDPSSCHRSHQAWTCLPLYYIYQTNCLIVCLHVCVCPSQFWFAVLSGYSGQIVFERWSIGLYNVVCILTHNYFCCYALCQMFMPCTFHQG